MIQSGKKVYNNAKWENLLKKRVWAFSIFGALCVTVFSAIAAAPVNPRVVEKHIVDARGADGALTRNAARTVRTRSAMRPRTGTVLSRSGTTRVVASAPRSATTVARTATVARAATKTNARSARVSQSVPNNGIARSAKARATAIFNDVTKIGSGYAECRESYATCMDQMCANANDTYRRCFCSDKFTTIRDTENRLDQAMIMLQQFQDNNLNVVDKTAAEVNAMYTATVGEDAIKNDTGASAQLLASIDDLLSGKTPVADNRSAADSLGILNLDLTPDIGDDIWGNATNSIFDSSERDMSNLMGSALFNAAQNQCVRLARNKCENDAVFNMTKSSYNILITQDCNAYEKSLNKKRETLAQAVRTAEKYLREARLEEYRTHNSADVNECLSRVRTAMLSETACGEDYKRCLDPTGAYVNASTGDPIYSPRLFQLESTMSLSGNISDDVFAQNAAYNNYLEGYRKYVAQELDTCRDISDFVWTEFKRMALIEIAQAQSALLEDVRSSCVETIAKCYDKQSGGLINFAGAASTSTATTAGALGRMVAGSMCREQVVACAALYAPAGSNVKCSIDGRGRLENGSTCGLQALLDYIDTVDSINIAEKCGDAIDDYLTKLCTPSDSHTYPYNCKTLAPGNKNSNALANNGLAGMIRTFANNNCKASGATSYDNDAQVKAVVESAITKIHDEMRYMFRTECQKLDGIWFDADPKNTNDEDKLLTAFYTNLFARDESAAKDWGFCYESSDRTKCTGYNTDDETVATWNPQTEQCTFTDVWYKTQCEEMLGGHYENAQCYMLD